MMKVGSLFSGIGGLDLGLERAGWEVKWQVENDEWCTRVLAKHWPNVPKYGDIKEVSGYDLEEVDLIAGGFPCQPVSLAGKREAEADLRWLWPEFLRIVSEVRPRFVLVENVPGLLTKGMARVIGDLSSCGYDTEWDCIPAAAVGAPHLRLRVFIFAYIDQSRLERCGEKYRLQEDSKKVKISRSSWWRTEPSVGRVVYGFPSFLDGVVITNAHESCFQKSRTEGLSNAWQVRVLWQSGELTTTSSESERCVVCDHPLSDLPYASPHGGWDVGEWIETTKGVCRLWGSVCELQSCSGQDLRPEVFKRTWEEKCKQKVGSRVNRLRGLGNAVVPQVAEWIGRRIMLASGEEK